MTEFTPLTNRARLLLLTLLLASGCHGSDVASSGMQQKGIDGPYDTGVADVMMQEVPGENIRHFIPSCYEVERIIRGGDLDKDGVADAVLICIRKNTAGCGAPADTMAYDERPRTLSVLLGNAAGGYSLFKTSRELPGIRFGQEDVLDTVRIAGRGTLQITLHYEVGRVKGTTLYTFRLQEGAFELIGLDISQGNAEFGDSYQYNLSTGQYSYSLDHEGEGEAPFKESGNGVMKMKRPRLFAGNDDEGFALQVMENEVIDAIRKDANRQHGSH